MEFSTIIWIIIVVGFFYFMMKGGGGCCGGHSGKAGRGRDGGAGSNESGAKVKDDGEGKKGCF